MASEKNKDANAPEVKKVLQPASVTPVDDPGKHGHDNIKLSFGQVALVSIDGNGNEGLPFIVNTSTYQQYYQDETRFRLKKTFL